MKTNVKKKRKEKYTYIIHFVALNYFISRASRILNVFSIKYNLWEDFCLPLLCHLVGSIKNFNLTLKVN